MLRIAAITALLAGAFPAADTRRVTVRFLGGAKLTPLEGLRVTVRASTGDWTADLKNEVAERKTGKDGTAAFNLSDGHYYVDIGSEKELPYLRLPAGYEGHPSHYTRMIQVGERQSFVFNLADACRLTLRAVDADTGEGIPGVVFVTENALGELWGLPINGDNIGGRILIENWTDDSLKTDKDGNFVRFMGPRPGYTYYVWTVPKGYERPEAFGETELETPLNTTKLEHVFKIRKKR